MPPKRLFHVPSMSTVMYKDNADDVREKGYAAISHVWGFQQMYTADELGINSGIDWKVPLSNIDKISRIAKVVEHFKVEYIWFDVLCMPQDKQDEINLEIPFMGDYYSGAKMTIILATTNWNLSTNFVKWFDMVLNAMDDDRNFTDEENGWMESYKGDKLLDVSKETWFTRVWTYQEAVLSNWLVVVDNKDCINLTGLVERIEYMNSKNPFLLSNLFDETGFLDRLGYDITLYKCNSTELAYALNSICQRDCYKIHDKFYATLGMLGYEDFNVDYNISIDDLNIKMAQYAYSKGDVSWMSICGNVPNSFIQPMYREFTNIGTFWKENIPGMMFDKDSIQVDMSLFATVTRSKRVGFGLGGREFVKKAVNAFRNWGFGDKDIIHQIGRFSTLPTIYTEIAEIILDDFMTYTTGKDTENRLDTLFDGKYSDSKELVISVESELLVNNAIYEMSVVEAILRTGQLIPLIIYGIADVIDSVMVPRIKDLENKYLGIVLGPNGRKGICICYNVEGEYSQHRFVLKPMSDAGLCNLIGGHTS